VVVAHTDFTAMKPEREPNLSTSRGNVLTTIHFNLNSFPGAVVIPPFCTIRPPALSLLEDERITELKHRPCVHELAVATRQIPMPVGWPMLTRLSVVSSRLGVYFFFFFICIVLPELCKFKW
jgi:hypothetical protein